MDSHFHRLAVVIAGTGLSLLLFSLGFRPSSSNQLVTSPPMIESSNVSYEIK